MFKKFFILFAAVLVVLQSCNKDEHNTISEPIVDNSSKTADISVEDGRLNFSSQSVFDKLANEYHNGSVPSTSKLSSVSSLKYVSLKQAKLMSENTGSLSKGEEELDVDLVPDEFFASLLNEKHEIEVGGIIYKVTPYGTFVVPAEKIEELYNILADEDPAVNVLSDLSSHPFYSNTTDITDMYKVAEGIFLYDTFKKKENRTYEVVSSVNHPLDDFDGEKNSMASKSTDPYGDIQEYNFGAHTIAGKIISGILGRNEIKYREWGSKRRLRVNFYDTKYVVYSALGLSGKFQKKNWVGWSATDCNEMRMGVQALKYQAFTIPSSQTPPNSNNVITSYMNPPQGFNPINSGPYLHVDLLGVHTFKISQYEAAYNAAKLAYNYAKSRLGNSLPSENKVSYNVWYADGRAGFLCGLDEKRLYNTSGDGHVFTWGTCTIGLSWNGTTWIPNVTGSVANTIKLVEADVYVTALLDNNWQGVRIVMK